MSISLYNAIYRRLESDGTIAGYVGTDIFNGEALSNDFPLIIVDLDQQIDEAIAAKSGPHWDLNLKIIAANDITRDLLTDAVRSRLNRSSWTDSNVTVLSTLLERESSSVQSIDGNVENLLYITEQDFTIIAGE